MEKQSSIESTKSKEDIKKSSLNEKSQYTKKFSDSRQSKSFVKENSNITILTNREPFQVGSKELNLLSSMNSVISNDDSFLKKRSSISDMILQNPHLFSLILKMQIRMKRFLVNIRSKHPQKSKMEIVDEDETTHMEDSHQQKFETVNESKNEENLSKHYKQENPNFQSVTTLRSLDSINFSFTANPKNRSSLYLVNLRETQLTFASKEGEKNE